MATSADAERALAALLADAVAPLPVVTKIIRGWPAPNALDAEMLAGNVIVSVYRLEVSRNTSRYMGTQASSVVVAPTLVASTSGASATFSGSAANGQVAGVVAGGIAYAVHTQAGDTPASVAGRVGALMPGPVTVSGATITAGRLTDARTAASAVASQEVGRQENTLQVDVWCPTPDLRDQAEGLVLPAIGQMPFLAMPDGSRARMRITSVMASDQASPLTIYRLMVRATAEVVLSTSEAASVMLWPDFQLTGA